jgi:hypothetical protein
MDTWVVQLKSTAQDVQSQLSSPGVGTASAIQADVTEAKQATNQLATTLKGLGAPPSENGQTAQSLVQSLATTVQQTATKVQQEVDTLKSSSSLSESAKAMASISTEISAAVAQAQSTRQSLQGLAGEFKDSFSKVDSCKQLQKDLG